MRFLVIILASAGLYISSYFTLVYYGLLKADSRIVPAFCRLEERTCQTVLNTKYARVLGVPNSLLGAIYYFLILMMLGTQMFSSSAMLHSLVAVSWITVAFGVFLTYSLLYILRVPCPLCLAGHAINLTLAIIFTIWGPVLKRIWS